MPPSRSKAVVALRINILRRHLNRLTRKKALTDPEVVKLSQKIDDEVTKYYTVLKEEYSSDRIWREGQG